MLIKLNFSRTSSLSSSPIIFSLLLLHNNNNKTKKLLRSSSCCSISSSSCSPPPPQTPLFLRPPIFSATLSDLRTWRHWAQTLASSTFLHLDNGPTSDLLLRELNWLIQDALLNPQTLSAQPPTVHDHRISLSLRADLEHLYLLWKQRIQDRRPFQYVVGCEHWRDLVLSVQEGVLIPRPETELIVDLVGDAILNNNQGLKEGFWADLGTGSGAIAIGIARILGNSGSVIATDLSPVAVQVASFNVQRFNLQDKIEIKQGSWFEPLKELEGELVGLVSNPPYIPSEHISGLQAEVAHEPRLALDGGRNGTSDLLHLCHGAVSMLKPHGFFAFEVPPILQFAIASLFKFLLEYMEIKLKGSFYDLNIVSDFAGIQRFVTGFRAR
ncbi:hypothetical protein LguiB_030311 [Lonicera macranthoides]